MTRVKGGSVARARRKKILKQAKGYFGSKHRLFKTAKEQVMHSGVYAYRDRKQNKRNFRKLWIIRINAACRENEISYSKFINGLTKAGVVINRKMLSEIAIDSPETFTNFVNIAKDALEGIEYKPKAVKLDKAETKAEPKEEKAPVKKATTAKKAAVAKKPAEVKEETTAKKTETVKKTTATKKATTEAKPAVKKTATKTTAKVATKKAEKETK